MRPETHSVPPGAAGKGDRVDDGIFDEAVAAEYDATVADRFRPEVLDPTVDRLAELASGGRALELAVGTGRVALPLAERGIEVVGIERSRAMVAQLRAKPGGDVLAVTIGDMATTRVPGSFRLVYLVFSTLSNLLTQDAQVACVANAADHLEPGGWFVVEAGVPDLRRLPPGERIVAFEATERHLGFDEYDVAAQVLTSHHVWFDGERTSRFASTHRYAFPAELDLMARLAGLELRHRWSTWHRDPFTSESTDHISIWQKPEPDGSVSRAG